VSDSLRQKFNVVLGVLICAFTIFEVNFVTLKPHTVYVIFAMFGLVLCLVNKPLHKKFEDNKYLRWFDVLLALVTVGICTYLITQSEPAFKGIWVSGEMLVKRAGEENSFEIILGIIGLVIVLEATRRSIGWTLPILALIFMTYAFVGPHLPEWLFPHRGYNLDRVVAQSFLQDQGVFGIALQIMFKYVFLFVIFGAFLKATGATQFIIDFSNRLFAKSTGGAAKVSVLSSGLMGSLSGSAVANTMTTGTFTIPLMRSGGFSARMAAGVEAAASSGGALVPPVMGAGAYMMLELVEPTVTFMEIIRAALIPAVLYYLTLFFIVHYYSKGLKTQEKAGEKDTPKGPMITFEGIIFFVAFATFLLFLLVGGTTVFRAVSYSILAIVILSSFNERTRLNTKKVLDACKDSAIDVIPLVTAAAAVGIIMGVVFLTGFGTKLPAAIEPMMQNIESAASGISFIDPQTISLLGALFIIMMTSIVLGMGLPSAVCYLLIVTMLGSVLTKLGVVPLAAHFFIFYFGMMSMVTPPVALAAYAAATISGTNIMKTGVTAFKIAIAGFTLPYMFVLQPELLMLTPDGKLASAMIIIPSVVLAIAGLYAYSLALTGYFFKKLTKGLRTVLFISATLLLIPGFQISETISVSWLDIVGLVLLAVVAFINKKAPDVEPNEPEEGEPSIEDEPKGNESVTA